MDPQSGEALSSVVYPTMEGGASPLPESDLSFSDDWNYQYFVIVPMSQIKPYNHEVVSRMIHRLILKELGDFDRDAFPPFLESWSNPMSMCIKIVCNRKVFQRISRECQQIFLGFGGSSDAPVLPDEWSDPVAMNFNTGIGNRHTVTFPESEYVLDQYDVSFSWDESRESFMALVTLVNFPKSGGHSSETLVVYSRPDDSTETAYRSLAEALKLSGKPWKIRKLWYSPKNWKLRSKLKQYGWKEQK